MRNFAIFVEGIESIMDVTNLPAEIERAAYRAVNATADWTRTRSGEDIRDQINFPASYLRPSEGKLVVGSRAGPGSLYAEITAQRRPTSLARFVHSGTPGKQGLSVMVKPGKSQDLKRAFLMKLRAGNLPIDTKSNLGLAVRTKRGERPDSAYKPTKVSDSLWLLYGPSVDQVFRSVREDIKPEAEAYLNREFQRLLDAKL